MYPVGGISASIYANRLRAEGMGSKDQAVPFCNQDYEALKQQCVESGCLFEDPYFAAEPLALGFKELAPHSSKTRGVEWQRPTVRKPHQKGYNWHILRIFLDLLQWDYILSSVELDELYSCSILDIGLVWSVHFNKDTLISPCLLNCLFCYCYSVFTATAPVSVFNYLFIQKHLLGV